MWIRLYNYYLKSEQLSYSTPTSFLSQNICSAQNNDDNEGCLLLPPSDGARVSIWIVCRCKLLEIEYIHLNVLVLHAMIQLTQTKKEENETPFFSSLGDIFVFLQPLVASTCLVCTRSLRPLRFVRAAVRRQFIHASKF